jgi:hypothetical protein
MTTVTARASSGLSVAPAGPDFPAHEVLVPNNRAGNDDQDQQAGQWQAEQTHTSVSGRSLRANRSLKCKVSDLRSPVN